MWLYIKSWSASALMHTIFCLVSALKVSGCLKVWPISRYIGYDFQIFKFSPGTSFASQVSSAKE